MIPKKATGGKIKYNFGDMKTGSCCWLPAKNYAHARSIRVCAIKRGYKACIRTVGNEVRVYLDESKRQ